MLLFLQCPVLFDDRVPHFYLGTDFAEPGAKRHEGRHIFHYVS